jgi:hypothetical protein
MTNVTIDWDSSELLGATNPASRDWLVSRAWSGRERTGEQGQ